MLLIQSILFFILGAACASFFMLLLAPMIWRRATTLAHQAVRMEVPLSLNEVEAEHDFARARHGVEICRLEEKVSRAKKCEMEAQLALDMAHAQICYLTPFAEEAAHLQQDVLLMRKEIKEIQQQNTAQCLKLEKMALLAQKVKREHELTKKQKAIIKTLKRQISALRKQLARIEAQKDVLEASQKQQDKRQQIENAELSLLREELKQLGAHIVANIAFTQDENLPLNAMLRDSAGKDDLTDAIYQATMTVEQLRSEQKSQTG